MVLKVHQLLRDLRGLLALTVQRRLRHHRAPRPLAMVARPAPNTVPLSLQANLPATDLRLLPVTDTSPPLHPTVVTERIVYDVSSP